MRYRRRLRQGTSWTLRYHRPMPVVRISGLPQPPGVDLGSVLKRLCLSLADVDGVEARHWWATWQPDRS